jgi:hypothetical protein
MRHFLFIFTLLSFLPELVISQDITQVIKGTVVDNASRIPLPGATVIILDADPVIGTTTDPDGKFRLDGVKVGRYNIQVSFVGYKTFIAREIIVGSGKETVLNIELSESVESLKQVEIKASSNKTEPLNTMTTVSARQVNMEEAKRYAGGFNDHSRLVCSESMSQPKARSKKGLPHHIFSITGILHWASWRLSCLPKWGSSLIRIFHINLTSLQKQAHFPSGAGTS